MKVILKEDVKKVGRRDEVKEVKRGFARNFLFPRGLAEPADTLHERELARRQERRQTEEKLRVELFSESLKKLEKITVHLTRKADEKGNLFAAIHASDIAGELEREHRITFEESAIEIATPIKSIGNHSVSIVDGDKKTPLAVEIARLP